MDALELLVNRRSFPRPNRHPSASSWKTFCVPECVRRTMAHCSRGTSLLKAKGATASAICWSRGYCRRPMKGD